MKHIFVLLITLIPILGQSQAIRKVNKTTTGVEITFPDGVLSLHPMSDNAIRVRFTENITPIEPSLIFSTESEPTDFKLSEPVMEMNLPVASGRGILMDFLFFISPQATGINPKRLTSFYAEI